MADNNQQKPIRMGPLRKIGDRLQASSDNLYRSTYYAEPENKRQLNILKTDIDKSIKQIIDTNYDNVGEPSISKLYERILMTQHDDATITDFEKIFGDNEFVNNLTASYMDNRWVKEVDQEIDQVLKYMPKLQEALDVITDNVLSSDSFSKEYLSMESQLGRSAYSQEQFDRNIEDLKTKYNAEEFTEDLVKSISKYGEVFIYMVPYTKAIQRLLDTKDFNDNVTVRTNQTESSIIIESTVEGIPKSVIDTKPFKLTEPDMDINVSFEVDNSGVIQSIVRKENNARVMRESVNEQSLCEQFLTEDIDYISNTGFPTHFNKVTDHDLEMGKKLPVHHNFDYTLPDSLDLPNNEDTTADGLLVNNDKPKKIKDMNGCIMQVLKREQVQPIIMNDICLGYYYFETDAQQGLFEERFTTTGMVNTITGLRSNGRSEAFDAMQRREELIRSIASQIASKIDKKFIDANQDLKKEIYYILKYNQDFNTASQSANNIRVTYIPPEDIKHCYYKLDKDTGRGISDLNLSLIPAKLWVAIYITNCLAIMTRGNDKRVYYVKQTVESNISKTLLKTINEIKKSNFGIRQVENINNVLNISGRFNDFIIPRGSDGQSPIEFEVMQGQQIEIKTELLNLLEESAINIIGVPIEIIQNRQSPDYAIQLTMSNSKFLRFVYRRQAVVQRILSDIWTRVYDIEYGSKDNINVTLPPPLFINITNTNQLIVNVNDYCTNITETYLADEQDELVKARFNKRLKIHHLSPYLNMDLINDIYNKAKHETTMDTVTNPENIEQ